MFNGMSGEILKSVFETLYMVISSTALSCLFGLPLGIALFAFKKDGLKPCPKLFEVLSLIVNILRSIPFIILLVLLIPFTRLIVGSSIGSTAMIVPLSIGAIPFFARIVENIFLELPRGLIDTGCAFGATPMQTIQLILLPEARPAIVNGITLTFVTLISYSAMAGAVGGGGLGALAINYGYQRFNFTVLIITVLILIALVQLAQWLGTMISKALQA